MKTHLGYPYGHPGTHGNEGSGYKPGVQMNEAGYQAPRGQPEAQTTAVNAHDPYYEQRGTRTSMQSGYYVGAPAENFVPPPPSI